MASDISSLLLGTFMKTCGALPASVKALDEAALKLGYAPSAPAVEPAKSAAPFQIRFWRIGANPNDKTISFVFANGKFPNVCGLQMIGESPGTGKLLQEQLRLGSPAEELPNKMGKVTIWNVNRPAMKLTYTWSQTKFAGVSYTGLKVIYGKAE